MELVDRALQQLRKVRIQVRVYRYFSNYSFREGRSPSDAPPLDARKFLSARKKVPAEHGNEGVIRNSA